jgi:hypothetical protein
MKSMLLAIFGQFVWLTLSEHTKYKGTWHNAKPHGVGALKYSSGATYSGVFRDGVKCGYGHYISTSGYEYLGEFFHGQKSGYAKIHYKNGDRYCGQVKNGLRQGKGEFYQAATDRKYLGEWSYDLVVGVVEVIDQSWRFEGTINVKTQSAVGVIIYKDDTKYSGQLCCFRREGEGTLELPSGKIISGTWSRDVDVRSAIMIDEYGFQWCGDLNDLKPNGYMKTTRPDGICYDGLWDNGIMMQSLSVEVKKHKESIKLS